MASPIGERGTFSIKTDDQGSSIPIHISEQPGVSSENLSLSTWGASFVLANLLHKIDVPRLDRSSNHDRRPSVSAAALELGAGTGLVGLSASAIWKCDIVLTDLPRILPGLDANIRLNAASLAKSHCSASCGSLDWREPNSISLFPEGEAELPDEMQGQLSSDSTSKPRVILAADTIYSWEHPELLTRTITTWLAPGSSSRAILCYPLRMAYIDHIREFWQLMEAAGFKCIQEGREQGNEDWNEVAHTPYEWCIWAWPEDGRLEE